jgi:hypothetical protein
MIATEYLANLSLDGTNTTSELSAGLAPKFPEIPVRERRPLISSVIAITRRQLLPVRPEIGPSDAVLLQRIRERAPDLWPLVDALPPQMAGMLARCLCDLVPWLPAQFVSADGKLFSRGLPGVATLKWLASRWCDELYENCPRSQSLGYSRSAAR